MVIDKEKFLSELEHLVNMDSGRGNPAGINAVGEFFADRFTAMGYIVERRALSPASGDCFIMKNREVAHYDALLLGHLDTVFPMGETAKRPFRRDEKRAYGLGVLDMKQGCLAMLYILQSLPREVNDKLNIVAIFNPDEEMGSIHSEPVLKEYARRTDYAYIFEAASTDGSHTIERKGLTCFKSTLHGIAGHAGYIFDGGSVSAINELIYWANAFNSLHSKERGTGVNIGVIHAGVAANIVPDTAHIELEVRYRDLNEYARLLELTEKLKAHARDAGIDITIDSLHSTPPLMPDERTYAYVERMREVANKLDIPFKLKPRGGLSDANHIAAYGPICVDGLGPTGDFDHSDREYLELSTIEPNLRFAHALLNELAEHKIQSNEATK